MTPITDKIKQIPDGGIKRPETFCEKDHDHTWWCYINGNPVDPAEAERIHQILKDANPGIIEAVKRREQIGLAARFRPLVSPALEQAQRDASTWYAQYQAWMKRGMEAEAREAALVSELETAKRALGLANEVIESLYPAIGYKGLQVVWSDGDRKWTRSKIAEYQAALKSE